MRIWLDRWIPSLDEVHPTPLGEVAVSRNTRVDSIICHSLGSWDFDFLRPFLSMDDQIAISETSLRDTSKRDWLIWPLEKHGSYSVKSGYHWAHSRYGICTGLRPSSIQLVLECVWKCIWKLSVPLKIQIFLWKSVHRALPSLIDLFKRKSSPSLICPICNISEEFVEHMFIRCPWVAVIWFGGPLNYRVDSAGNLTWVQ